jgi:hypothetical protein
MGQGEELGLTTTPSSETVLAVGKDLEFVQVAHDVAGDDVFLDLAA